MREIERREGRSNIILQMACGKEKGQLTVVFRDMLVHHEKPEVFRDNVCGHTYSERS